jgi:RNA polymerase sigma factor (sigma-70 family)
MDKKTLTEEDALFVRGICIRGFGKNKELANDCFLYVWEKLHENESHRIRALKRESSFRTFLYSVTNKLIIDFRRTQFRYKVLPKYFWKFDEINRYIFKLFFYQNLTPGWIENAVQAEFKISQDEAQRRVDEVEKRIRESRVRVDTPVQREPLSLWGGENALSSKNTRSNPEENVIKAEIKQKREKVLEVLKGEIKKLEAEDVLILQLYFEHGLTAKEISGAILGIKDKGVYKRIDRMLRNLKKCLGDKGITEADIEEIFELLL